MDAILDTVEAVLEDLAKDGEVTIDLDANPGLLAKIRVALAEVGERADVRRHTGANLRNLATLSIAHMSGCRGHCARCHACLLPVAFRKLGRDGVCRDCKQRERCKGSNWTSGAWLKTQRPVPCTAKRVEGSAYCAKHGGGK